MAHKGKTGVRAAFADAVAQAARTIEREDPAPEMERHGHLPGMWPGAPYERLPPHCPVIPLGMQDKTSFFIDTLGQLIAVDSGEWGKKILVNLFSLQPNYLYWAWPRWSEEKKDSKGNVTRSSKINGVDVDEAVACLVKACAQRGLFDPTEHIRGRGAWTDRAGRLIWHSGDALWTVENGKLKSSHPGEIDGIFYPRRPPVLEPWREPVDADDTPALAILNALRTWTWERPGIDPVIVVGCIGVMLLSGALKTRPHMAAMGDKSVGKSELQALVKTVIGSALLDTGNTSAAGIYQRMKRDCLPVAADEFEASEDNRRAGQLIELARIAFSGARMYRGGQDNVGVEYTLRSTFFMSGINLPPMKSQDKSRFAVLNLGKIDASRIGTPPVLNADSDGRMILRALMDAWPRYPATLERWAGVMREAGLDGRGARDVYGTIFAVAELLLGEMVLEDIGLPVTEPQRLAELLGEATASERAEQRDNWRSCLEHLLGSPIEAWKAGERPTVGGVFEALHSTAAAYPEGLTGNDARTRLQAAGLSLRESAKGSNRWWLAVPADGPLLQRMFAGTAWQGGVWTGALKQAPTDIVIRDRGNEHVIKINGAVKRCLLIDLQAYEALAQPEPEPV